MDKAKQIELVKKAQAGDGDALGALFQAHQPGIYYFIQMSVKNKELAEDLTQETFIEIMETIGSLQDPAAFVSWSHRIAWHRCTAHFRKRQDVLLGDDGEEEFDRIANEPETNAEFIPDEALDKKELRKTILAMVEQLPETQRAVILLHYFTELPIKDIARIQDVSENTVKSRLNYGRKALKEAVETYEKKNGIKLRCAGVVPLLLWLFGEAAKTEAAAAAAVGGAGTAATVGTAAAKTAGGILSKKAIAGIAAALVAGGVVTTALLGSQEELHWYGNTGLGVENLFDVHSTWLDLELETLSDDAIAGQLLVTKEGDTVYDIRFDGIGTELEDNDPGTTNKIQYDLTFSETQIVDMFGTWEHDTATITYDPAADSFYIKELMYVYEDITLLRSGSETVEVLDENVVWEGDGWDKFPYQDRKCHVRVEVEEMTNIGIRGKLIASNADGVFHETRFTGRGIFHNDRYFYHLILETPRTGETFLVDDNFIMLMYIPESDSFGTLDSFNTEIYAVALERSN